MDAMISLQCSSAEKIAKELNSFLRNKGYSTWICIEMQGGVTYREEIVVNASGSKTMIALMNVRWAESKECRYEFNIALRSQLTKGLPHIIPIVLESFDFNTYPLITGVMANTNAIFYNPKDPNSTWGQVVDSLSSVLVNPTTPEVKLSTVASFGGDESFPENVADWQSEHVGAWFHSLNLPNSSKDIFLSNWVDGPMLLEMTIDEMKDSLQLSGLQAKRLTREINSLKSSSCSQSTEEIEEAAPNVGQFKSLKGFATGLWKGFFMYKGKSSRDDTSMDVTMVAGIVAGYGTDTVGDFHVQGTYSDDNLSITWDKSYIGKHVVYYNGTLKGNTITGEWHTSASWYGSFQLTFEKQQDELPALQLKSSAMTQRLKMKQGRQ